MFRNKIQFKTRIRPLRLNKLYTITMPEPDFYITLPSNASMEKYPDNRPGNLKVDLSHRHELNDGQWEMGLSEIQFTPN